jgi:hypothetical protein
MTSKSTQLLKRISVRLRLVSIGRQWYRSFLLFSALYAAAFIVARLTGLITDVFSPESLLIIPALASAACLIFHRRPTPAEAAREVDRASGTKDLFLTSTMLERSPGEFKPLVERGAESKAPEIKPVAVVPFRPGRRIANASVLAVVLLIGVMSITTGFDPFGAVEASEEITREEKKLKESQKTTVARMAKIQRDESKTSQSKEVKKAVEKLMASFNQMKPTAPKMNQHMLRQNKKALGAKYGKLSTDKLREFLSQTPLSQQFGGPNREQTQKWARELQNGSTEALHKELEEMKELLKRLAKTGDPVERAEMQNKLRKKLQDMIDFANRKAGSKELAAALERAMEQLEMSKKLAGKKQSSAEAMKALEESLELSKLELKQMAQSLKDLKELEEALKACQMAEQANQKEALDGKECEGCKSMAAYAELYAKLMRERGDGTGDPEGGGGMVEEDDSTKSDFKTEKAKSAITAGKILLSMKTKGLGDKGEAKVEYREAARNVRQGVSEAIRSEEVPPGYHDGIKGYFESITPVEESGAPESGETESDGES